LAETTRLITGTLPAQFGFAPAGVISVTTKNGLYQHGGQAEFFAASNNMVEPAIEWAGSAAGTSLFGSASFEHDRSTVADVQGLSATDRRNEIEGLGFADHVIDAENRFSIVAGGSGEKRRIGATAIGPGTERSSDGYLVGTFQHSDHRLSVQASLFGGLASDQSVFAERTRERRSTFGSQIDSASQLGSANTLRLGLLASRSLVRELDPAGDRMSKDRTAVALYAQDEWNIISSLTLNPGARIEWARGFVSSAKVEPRASIVWQSKGGMTAHAGYARYASAAPLGDGVGGTALPDESDDYLDAGVQQRLGALTIAVDGYWRKARNYLTQHETPGHATSTAFAFRQARIEGVELSAT
jgi:hypothetical protein